VKAAFGTESCQARDPLYLGKQDARCAGSNNLAVVTCTSVSPGQEPPPAIPITRGDGVSRTELPLYGSIVDFRGIYQSYGRDVYSLCLRIIGDRTEAEAVTQEAFLQIFRRIDTCCSTSTFAIWLYRVVLTVLLNRVIKREKRYGTSPAISPNGARCSLRTVSKAPHASLLDTIDRSALEKAILRLPLELRVVFVLHDVLGRDQREVAETLEFSCDTCKSQLLKARLRLRELLLC
jgi:RNA polymerase sigma-70 factor (ECF subfamily)